MVVLTSRSKRSLRDARSGAAVDHHHLLQTYNIGDDRMVSVVVMPLLQGETLDARLRSNVGLSISKGLHLGRETAAGLTAAHKKGFIHREIKHTNILLEQNTPKRGESRFCDVNILDFGLADATSQDDRQLKRYVDCSNDGYSGVSRGRVRNAFVHSRRSATAETGRTLTVLELNCFPWWMSSPRVANLHPQIGARIDR